MKYRAKAWITIGGHPCEEGEGQHCEGTKVEIEGGTVRKGPKGLRGRQLPLRVQPSRIHKQERVRPSQIPDRPIEEETEKPSPQIPASRLQEQERIRLNETLDEFFDRPIEEQEQPVVPPSRLQEQGPVQHHQEPKPKKTKAKVEFPYKDIQEKVEKLAQDFFKTKDVDWAALVGAPDSAHVSLNATNIDGHDVITFTINHPQYQAERYLGRDEDGKLFIKNDAFFMGDGQTGTGLGTKVFSDQVQWAQEQGIAYIKTDAAKSSSMNGYYTWARMGYDAPIDTLFHHAQEKVKKAFPNAQSVLDITNTAAGREWWKKNGDWMRNAKFDLTPNSRSLKTLNDYLEERKARK